MAAKFIPLEEVADYRPWPFSGLELAQAKDEEPSQLEDQLEIEADTGVDSHDVDEPPASPNAQTSEDIGQIYHDAHREGYEAGLVEGLEAGHAEGLEAGRTEGLELGRQQGREQALLEARPLAELIAGFSKATQHAYHEISEDVVALALDVARQMVRESLKANPSLVLSVVRGAMESMPQGMQHPHIHLHPEDALLVRGLLKDEFPHAGWKIIEDHRIERGGCRIECATAELDATMPSRWRRIAAALGQDHSWLENGH